MSPFPLFNAARLAGGSLLKLQADERLVALAASGHAPAFEAIVARYRAELVRYCNRLVGPARAEDVVQQAFLNAHLAMSSHDPDTLRLRPWLYRIAHNAAVTVLRVGHAEDELDGRAAAPGGVEDDAEVRERLGAALAAIARLPEPQRDALTLQAIDGRTHEEIADAMGITAGAARQHVHRARTTMRAVVTAITPYDLLARVAFGGGGSPASMPEVAAGVGAGAGATVAKLGAGILAAGALAGGTVLPPSPTHHRQAANASVVSGAKASHGGAAAGDPGSGRVAIRVNADGDGGPRGEDRHGRGSRGGRGGRGGADDRRGSGDDRSGSGSGSSGSGSDDRSGSGSGSSGSGSGGSGGGSISGGPGPSTDDSSSSSSGSGSSGSGSSGSDTSGSGTSGSDGGLVDAASATVSDSSGSGSGDSGSRSLTEDGGSGPSPTSGTSGDSTSGSHSGPG